MKLNPSYLKILKSIKCFVLISFTFSYCCYGQKKLQANDNISSLQDYPISSKDDKAPSVQGYSPSNKDYNDKLVLDKSSRFFKENVERYFMNERGEFFDDGRKASQVFRSECLPERYLAFRTQINNYKQLVFHDEGDNYALSVRQGLINAIQQSMKSCRYQIYDQYVNLELEINERVKTTGFNSPDLVLSVLSSTISSQLPERVIKLKVFFEDWKTFRTHCISLIRMEPEEEGINSTKFREPQFGSLLEELYKNECVGLKKHFINFSSERKAFNEFIRTPALCNQQAGCVMKLRKDVGLDNLAPGEFNLFEILSEQTSRTNICCLMTDNCKHIPDAKPDYDVILQSVNNSYHKNICRSDGPERKTALKHFKRRTLGICRESEEMCSDKVDKVLADFRKRFLACFFLPDFNEQAYRLHAQDGNGCGKQIREIKEQFETSARLFTTKIHPEIMLESLSSPEGGSGGHPFVRKCLEPFNKLQDLLDARGSRFLSHTCSGQEQNKGEQSQAQAASANSSI